MESLIYTKDNALSQDLCAELIEKYKMDAKNKNQVKYRYSNCDKPIIDTLRNEIEQYIQTCFYRVATDVGDKHILTEHYYIRKIEANSSRHYDPPLLSAKSNCFSFVFYLNTADRAYHTFFDHIQVPSLAGRLIVFPCEWAFPYRQGCSPTEDIYVLSGTVFFHRN